MSFFTFFPFFTLCAVVHGGDTSPPAPRSFSVLQSSVGPYVVSSVTTQVVPGGGSFSATVEFPAFFFSLASYSLLSAAFRSTDGPFVAALGPTTNTSVEDGRTHSVLWRAGACSSLGVAALENLIFAGLDTNNSTARTITITSTSQVTIHAEFSLTMSMGTPLPVGPIGVSFLDNYSMLPVGGAGDAMDSFRLTVWGPGFDSPGDGFRWASQITAANNRYVSRRSPMRSSTAKFTIVGFATADSDVARSVRAPVSADTIKTLCEFQLPGDPLPGREPVDTVLFRETNRKDGVLIVDVQLSDVPVEGADEMFTFPPWSLRHVYMRIPITPLGTTWHLVPVKYRHATAALGVFTAFFAVVLAAQAFKMFKMQGKGGTIRATMDSEPFTMRA